MRVCDGSLDGFSVFFPDADNVFIDTVKPAEDGSDDIILRIYEAKRADTRCTLSINVPIHGVWDCDMLENKLKALPLEGGKVDLAFHTFEVKTLRLIIR
jgi:alpha-mannosidase